MINFTLGALTSAAICLVTIQFIPEPKPITVEKTVFVDTYYEIEVPRAPTWEEKVEAIQITIDGSYQSRKTDIETPPIPQRKG